MSILPPTRLEINLDALTHNFRVLKSKIKSSTKFLAVVKAEAYGSDYVAVALHLESLKVDYLAVVFSQEGVALRKGGVKCPILVFHPFQEFYSEMIAYNLEPSIYSFSILNTFLEFSKGKNVSIHLKLNTGLNRLGFDSIDIYDVIQKINTYNRVCIKSLYSHLGASEDQKAYLFTRSQIELFKKTLNLLKREMKYPLMGHILNTSGIFNFSEVAQMDMVRSGIGLHGFGNGAKCSGELRPISTLKTVISQIRTLSLGQSLGYNRAFFPEKLTRIATLPIGYADGIDRIYGKGKGYVYINNQKAYIVGNVCMDMIMVNVTDIDCRESDEVIIFGEQHSAETLSESVGTISYELITGIAPRVQRVILNSIS